MLACAVFLGGHPVKVGGCGPGSARRLVSTGTAGWLGFMQDTEGQAVDAGSRNSHCSADVLSSHTIVLI